MSEFSWTHGNKTHTHTPKHTHTLTHTHTHTHTHTLTHITCKLRQRVGTQAPTGESHGEREKVWAGKVVCVGVCEYARACVCICRVFAVVTAGMKEWRRRVWLEKVPTEQVSLYFHHTHKCVCVCLYVHEHYVHLCLWDCMYRTVWSCLLWVQYGTVSQMYTVCKLVSC